MTPGIEEKFIIFEAIGDLGKNLMATAVVRAIKKAYPDRKIVVMTLCPEVWLHNPDVFRFYSPGKTSYFYDDFINNKDTLIMRHDPVLTEDFIYGRKHLVEIWCNLCKVPADGLTPSLHYTWREKEAISKLSASEKPLLFIHTNIFPVAPNIPEFWATDLPLNIAQQVVNKMNAKGYSTVHLRTPTQPALDNALTMNLDTRQTLFAMSHASLGLFIDSFGQHVAEIFNIPSTVLWVTGKPEVTGYEDQKNIKAKAEGSLLDYISSYREGYDLMGAMLQCPHDLSKMFDADQIATGLLNQDKDNQKPQ